MRSLGRVSVLAPDHNWSASGHVKTLHRPLRVKETLLADGTPALATDGAPSDCVALAVLGLLDPVDLVVSGINPHANLGHDITYSGTVTAAMEAAIWGIRALAVSLDIPEDHGGPLDYSAAAAVALQIARVRMERDDLPAEILLNVNVPCLPEEQIRGYRVTRTGTRIYRDELVRREDPRGKPYYWIGGDAPGGVRSEGSDIGALADGYVSITPIQLDLTAHNWLARLESWPFPRKPGG